MPKSSTTSANWMGFVWCLHRPGVCGLWLNPCFAKRFANISFASRPACANPYTPLLFLHTRILHVQTRSPCITLWFHLVWVWPGSSCILVHPLECWCGSFQIFCHEFGPCWWYHTVEEELYCCQPCSFGWHLSLVIYPISPHGDSSSFLLFFLWPVITYKSCVSDFLVIWDFMILDEFHGLCALDSAF